MRRGAANAGRHLSSRKADLLGVGLLVLAALTVMGMWFGAGGPFGKLLLIASVGLLGPVGYAVPVLALFWAVLLLRGTAPEERGRMLVGLTVTLPGAVGIWSVAEGNPTPTAGYEIVRHGGGVLGALVARPLSRVVSSYGALAVCSGLVAMGLLVFTATPLAAVGRWLKNAVIETVE
ncbi:MAG TPA: DNA translocase FtsK 4TM domain-containing protein, partial [Actinomycetota bacterium]|nr:DNA translocase FtsK 4TM domain-containing protein [Actinomycetota bacterium]